MQRLASGDGRVACNYNELSVECGTLFLSP